MAKEVITVEYQIDLAPARKEVSDFGKEFDELDKKMEQSQRTGEKASEKRVIALKKEEKELERLRENYKKTFTAKEIELYTKRIAQVEKRIKLLRGESDKLAKSNSFLKDQFTQLGGAIAAAFAVEKIISFGIEAVKLASQAQGVKLAFDRLNDPTLLNRLRTATRGTISDLELMQQAVRAKNFKIPLENLGKFFEFARRRAKATGESVEFLTDSIVKGIGRRSPLILDNLGISVIRLREEMAKVGDISQAVANIIDEELGNMGDDIETASEKTARFAAGWENTKVTVGNALISIADDISAVSDATFGVLTTTERMDELKEAAEDAGVGYRELIKGSRTLTADGFKLTEQGKEIVQQFREQKEAAVTAANAVALLNFTQNLSRQVNLDTSRTINAINEDVKALKDTLLETTIGTQEFADTQRRIIELENELARALGKGNDAFATRLKLLKDLGRENKAIADDEFASGEAFSDALAKEFDAENSLDDDLIKLNEETGNTIKATNAVNDADQEAANIEFFESEKERKSANSQLAQDLVTEALNFDQAIINSQRARVEGEIKIERTRLEKGKINQEEFEENVKNIQRQQANREKQLAIFSATIQLAVAVLRALATGGPAAAAGVFAVGVVELAAIQLAELPAFKDGVIGFQGEGTDTSDSNLVKISKNESIMTAQETRDYGDYLRGMHSGNFNEMLDNDFNKRLSVELSGLGTKLNSEDSFDQSRKLGNALKKSDTNATKNADRIVSAINTNSELELLRFKKRFF